MIRLGIRAGKLLVASFAVASLAAVAQQPSHDSQTTSPTTQPAQTPAQAEPQSSSPATSPSSPTGAAAPAAAPESQPAQPETSAAPQTAPPELRSVKAELVNVLDTKVAKSGDSVEIKTKAPITTADGTEIPTGSKVEGHVVAVKASSSGQNSQISLLFDHAELKGGQSVAIQSQIQSIGSAADSNSAASNSATNEASPAGVPQTSAAQSPSAAGAAPDPSSTAAGRPNAPSASGQETAATSAGSRTPAPGTVVGRNGQIAIRTTSIPGVLLANNDVGQQYPSMARASSILVGSGKDVQLNHGTEMVLGLAAAAAAK